MKRESGRSDTFPFPCPTHAADVGKAAGQASGGGRQVEGKSPSGRPRNYEAKYEYHERQERCQRRQRDH